MACRNVQLSIPASSRRILVRHTGSEREEFSYRPRGSCFLYEKWLKHLMPKISTIQVTKDDLCYILKFLRKETESDRLINLACYVPKVQYMLCKKWYECDGVLIIQCLHQYKSRRLQFQLVFLSCALYVCLCFVYFRVVSFPFSAFFDSLHSLSLNFIPPVSSFPSFFSTFPLWATIVFFPEWLWWPGTVFPKSLSQHQWRTLDIVSRSSILFWL